MWAWTDRIGFLLFDAGFAAATFLTLIVLAMLACRQPARRILLARVALLASLGIPPLVAWGHLPRLDVIDTFVESRFFPRALVAAAMAVEPVRNPDGSRTIVAPIVLVPEWIVEQEDVARQWLPRGLTLMDLACVTVGGAWLVLGIAGMHWLIDRSRLPSPTALVLFDALLAGRAWEGRRPGLRVCPRLRHPVVTGLLRPMILIPESLDHRPDDDPEPLRLSLLHELAHFERSDHWFSTAASLAQSVWFFLPQVWWIRSQLLIDQEFLADRAAADRYGTSSDYASSLLSMAAGDVPTAPDDPDTRGPAAVPRPANPAGPSALFQRMMMLLNCPYPVESRIPRVWSWTSRLAVVLVSVAAACLVVRWPHSSLALSATRVDGPPRARFKSPHFLAEPLLDADGQWRSRIYVLPVTLPPRFDLDVDVLCPDTSRVQIRVIGESITIPGPMMTADLLDPPTDDDDNDENWHHLHIHRNPDDISIALDGQALADCIHAPPHSGWLTIESSSQTAAEFRDLVVSW